MNRTQKERAFLAAVRAARPLGYGRLIQIISHDWYRRDPDGAALALTSYGLLPLDIRRIYEELAELDPLFADDAQPPHDVHSPYQELAELDPLFAEQ